VQLDVVNVRSMPSSALTGNDILDVVRTVNTVIQEPAVKGVIVTHGTVSSEDTVYFLNLLVKSAKPIVLTNAQRMHGLIGNDGDRNFIDAVRVVLSPGAQGKGALLVHNETISAAREVVKTSAMPGAFRSWDFGFLGLISGGEVTFYRSPTRRHTVNSEFALEQITGSLPKVEVVSVYYDADPQVIEAVAKLGVKGIVLNGFTANGEATPAQTKVLEALASQGLPVVRTARGGGNNQIPARDDDRFIEGANLPAYKARLLLQLALTRTSDFKEIQRIFNEY
jgi:L-asparaginase